MTYSDLIENWAREEKISPEEAKIRYPERLVLYVRDALPEIWKEWVNDH